MTMDKWVKCEHCGKETSPKNLACMWCGLWKGYDYSTYPAKPKQPPPPDSAVGGNMDSTGRWIILALSFAAGLIVLWRTRKSASRDDTVPEIFRKGVRMDRHTLALGLVGVALFFLWGWLGIAP